MRAATGLPDLISERPICRLGQLFVCAQFLKASFENRRDDRKGIAARHELFWRIFHPGDLHEDVAELRGIALLLAVIARPHVFGLPSAA